MPAVAPHLKLDIPASSALVVLPGPEIARRSAEPYEPKDPRRIKDLKIDLLPGSKTTADVKVFAATMCRDDSCIQETHAVEFRPNQDVLDVLPIMRSKGKTYFGLTESFRPVLAARKNFDNSPEVNDGLLLSLPGGYLNASAGLDSIQGTAKRVLCNKLGISEEPGKILTLGGPYFPNPRASTELARPISIQIDGKSDTESSVIFGGGLQSMQATHWFTLEQIVDKFKRGEIRDLRAIDAILRHIRVNTARTEVSALREMMNLDASSYELSDQAKARILSPSSVRALLADPAKLSRNISQIKLEEIEPDGSNYLVSTRAQATSTTIEGKQAKFELDLVSHPTKPDSFDITAYFFHEGEPYLAIRDADRPAIAARELAEHPIYSPYPATHFEAIGGVVQSGLSPIELQETATNYLKRNFGVEFNGDLQKVGSGYPSPGFNPELETHFCVKIDPNATANSADSSVKFIKLRDVLQLIDEGLVRDLRLSFGSHLLAAATNNLVSQDNTLTDEQVALKGRYLKLINDGSQLTAWLCSEEDSRKLMQRFLEDPWARRLLYLTENTLGQVFARLSHEDERNFFSPIIPVYAMLKDKPSALLALHYFHDLRHYSCGDQVPARLNSAGKLETIPFNEFLRIYRENELVAGFFSDYIVPAVVGKEKAHQIMGRPNLKELFDDLGVNESEAYRLYCILEGEGRIPDELQSNLEVYRKYREHPIGDTFYAHHIFASHAKAVYQNWVDHPMVSETIIRFSDRAFFETAEQLKLFDATQQEVATVSEGFNPLQALISRTITWNIQREAAKIAFFAEENETLSLNDKHEVTEALDRLHDVYDELIVLRSNITDIEASDRNIGIFSRVEQLLRGELEDASRFSQELLFKLPIDKQRKYAGRELPFFKPLPFVDPSKFPKPPEV